MMTRSFPVVLVPQTDGGFFVDCPSLPGCHSQGDTRNEAIANIHEAIILVLEDMEELGEPLPQIQTPLLDEVSVTR